MTLAPAFQSNPPTVFVTFNEACGHLKSKNSLAYLNARSD